MSLFLLINFDIFAACQHAMHVECDIVIANESVCLSVRHTLVLYLNHTWVNDTGKTSIKLQLQLHKAEIDKIGYRPPALVADIYFFHAKITIDYLAIKVIKRQCRIIKDDGWCRAKDDVAYTIDFICTCWLLFIS